MDTAKVRMLAEKYLNGTATAEEAAALHEWYDHVNEGDTEIVVAEQATTLQDTGDRILRQLREQIAVGDTPVVPMEPRRRTWLPWTAAAAVLLIAGSTWFLRPSAEVEAPQSPIAAIDVPAPANKPTLTLGNGTVLDLSEHSDGALAQQGGSAVSKEESMLVYEPGHDGAQAVMNKLSVPKGVQYRIVLSDGTKVWLNAASELQFPSVFNGAQRQVTLVGEGYFEVAANANKPFVVQTGGPRIEVLGTAFNVKAYAEEPRVKTALLSGSVRVVAGEGRSRLMHIGEVNAVGGDREIKIISESDAEQAVAWKDGVFSFRNEYIAEILLEIGRWYDVEIVYEGPVSHRRFTGKVSRSYSLSETLSVLLASNLHFRQEGKKIIVMP
ncbi:FecR family protein [Chitinophaga sp.]|uniref:FecR family protein n=1 Tax=Chitinophaga sp. TaxID=1869181 RepID=UPI00261158FC|nr:FecR domain-containing protein [uncultured Chitinophaga sp.]